MSTLCVIYLRRWVRSAGKKIPIPSTLAVVKYAADMGHVDRFDKAVALSRLRLKRCRKRYHRVLGMWMLAAVNNNVLVLFDKTCKDVEELRKSKESKGLGYRHWFQNQLGDSIIKRGLSLAEKQWVYLSACRVNMFMRRCHRVIQRRRALARIRERIRFDIHHTIHYCAHTHNIQLDYCHLSPQSLAIV